MNRNRSLIPISIICALLAGAVVAQSAMAEVTGRTLFECSKSATTKTFSDPHCDKTTGTLEYGHVLFPSVKTLISVSNAETAAETKEPTTAVLSIPKIHGLSNVVVECTNVEGTGEALNSESGEVMKGSAVGTVRFNDGAGVNCSTNQAKCTAKVAEVNFKAETVEGLAPEKTGVGLKIEPATGTTFTTISFEGTCGLHAFGAIPITGSTIATAGGEPTGVGATETFTTTNEMNGLKVGGESGQMTGKTTVRRVSTGNAIVWTGKPWLNDA